MDPGPPPPPPPEPNPALIDRVVNYAVPLVGVVGAALYGVLRLAYLFFYLRLRASPDEVGYGYSQVLADELIGAIELVLLVTVIIMLPLAIIRAFSRLRKKTKEAGTCIRCGFPGCQYRRIVFVEPDRCGTNCSNWAPNSRMA